MHPGQRCGRSDGAAVDDAAVIVGPLVAMLRATVVASSVIAVESDPRLHFM